MQNFYYKMIDNETYAVMSYEGDEAAVVIPDIYNGKPVTLLADNLFAGHSEITSVAIPDSVTDIGGFVFDGCEKLHQVRLPAKLQNLWQYAFVRSSIEEIVLPEQMQSLVPFTFKDCKQLKRVVCNPGLKRIYAWAFSGCDQLEDVVYGSDTEVSDDAFSQKS